jgi:hypothetical protein
LYGYPPVHKRTLKVYSFSESHFVTLAQVLDLVRLVVPRATLRQLRLFEVCELSFGVNINASA